ncbi:MAG TPA: tetratricopeptide repeat protein [Candidatus Eisenbacteria bacterium]
MDKRRRKTPPRAGQTPPRSRTRALLWLAGILALTFVVYIPSIGNDFTNWDDQIYVTENPLLARPGASTVLTTPVSGNYHPLTIWSLALNYRLSGLHPASYHWLSLLLHLGNTALVLLFVLALSKGRLWTSVACSLFFGIHPMHVESVAWIAERKDVLYTFFYLLGLIAYLRFVDRRQKAGLVGAWVAMVLSVASKPAAVVFPVTLLAIDWFRRRPFRPSVLLEKIPFFVVSIAGGLLTLAAQQEAGAVALQWSAFQKLLFAAYGTAMYVVKLFLPLRLSAIYPYPTVEGQGPGPEYYLALVAVVVLLPLIVYLARRSRAILFGLAFFFINIFLVLQFVTVGEAVMADRYTYVPYIGLFFLLAWRLDERTETLPVRFPVRPVLAACLLLLVPLSLVQTWNRCAVWKNSLTLWNDTIGKYPRRIVDAYNNRGNYLYRVAGRQNDALADFNLALALNPKVAKVWLNKGNAHAALNQDDSAYVCFDRALALQPDYAEAIGNRGGIRLRRGDLTGAVEDFSRALGMDPKLRDAYTNRALAYSLMHEYEKAISDLRTAIRLNPLDPANHQYVEAIAAAFDALNRHREAIAEFDEAIRITPSESPRLGGYYLHRSFAWWALGERARALSDAREAERRGTPVDPAYLRALGG